MGGSSKLVVAPSTCSISGRLLPLQYYSRQTQAGGKTPKHNQAIRTGTIRNANILSPLDVKRKKDQPGCRWRRGLLVVGGRASVVVARTTVSLELFRSNFSSSNPVFRQPSFAAMGDSWHMWWSPDGQQHGSWYNVHTGYGSLLRI